ncbi:transmembrane protein [Lactobacillus amylovorus]|jgi:glucose uptake protein|uniref:GRP family sugar transporter n=5 Tax=Lactobacillus amylovorus TaxID=1604 RepID=F0TFZ9_LACAM|nr:GRP family sugar transporter [Lactobacillus amylovorus]ADQ59509.1 transmembrane protein [Lactobacillus amylovorus GRL 1112]ADZ07643.1 transmembrane protein [Lactobacillus amylovorus]AEA32323.1 transmembrane protein [Lactobacillus amylovorus GRL1118]ATO52549.1 sugar transporter [Lactobacillus amylovorus DSM 20531]KRK39956.1 transmembrane protein [Lactobacillus amylovorus DSM 20531]
MNYLFLFIPAIGWGLMPLFVAGVKKSNIYHQIVGSVLGAFLFGVVVTLIKRPAFNMTSFLLAMVAGAAWVVGQCGQYYSYSKIGVSETMPLSTGLQLIGVPLVGVLIFGEWASTQAKLFGFLGILALVVGVAFTSLTDKGTAEGNKQNQTSTMIILALTTLGYITSSSIPKALKGDGVMIFLGQTIGMMIATFIYLVATKQLKVLKEKESYQVIPAGVIFAIAALSYIISVQMNGVNLAFVMSQLCVVISTLGGIVFLHEQKTKKGYIYTAIGLVLIVAGAVLTSVF